MGRTRRRQLRVVSNMTVKHPRKPIQKNTGILAGKAPLMCALLLAAGVSFAATIKSEALLSLWTSSENASQITNTTIAASPPVSAPAQAPALSLSEGQARYIVRTTLKALHDAVRTGNFTVFRDLAGPSFQTRFKAAELHKRFQSIGQSGLDLSSISMLNPILTSAKAVEGSDMIRFDGYFASSPSPLMFGMIVEPHLGRWLVADYALDTLQPRAASAPGVQQIAGNP